MTREPPSQGREPHEKPARDRTAGETEAPGSGSLYPEPSRSRIVMPVLTPLAAVALAFVVGGFVIFLTGHDPLVAYSGILSGTGFTWLLPWLPDAERAGAARSLQQTLLTMTPLILTALAVAFPFRTGMFNIGGQGQYIVGLVAALVVGTGASGLPAAIHVPLAILAAVLAGAAWAGVAGALKAISGAHEVISTIMLNWIAVFGGMWLFELGGPLQGANPSVPRSDPVVEAARLPAIWGTLQPLHAGIFVAIGALVVFHLLLTRTTFGFEVRAVGLNSEAARYVGVGVRRSYLLALAVGGMFAGCAGALDLLGWKFQIATNDVGAGASIAFIGIAVAILGRSTAPGIFFAALLFAALQVGTSPRHLDPTVFPPTLAGNLATLIQALVILFVAAEATIARGWRRGWLRVSRRPEAVGR